MTKSRNWTPSPLPEPVTPASEVPVPAGSRGGVTGCRSGTESLLLRLVPCQGQICCRDSQRVHRGSLSSSDRPRAAGRSKARQQGIPGDDCQLAVGRGLGHVAVVGVTVFEPPVGVLGLGGKNGSDSCGLGHREFSRNIFLLAAPAGNAVTVRTRLAWAVPYRYQDPATKPKMELRESRICARQNPLRLLVPVPPQVL